MIDLLTRIASTESSVTTLDQTRTSNTVNQITAISETVGSSWVDPAYDDAGNMITGPLGTTPTTKLHFVFDAWNRMVTVKADSSGSPGSTIASYTYDGRNRRITKTIGGSTYHGYYNNNWQYLETRIDTATTSSGQIVWDLRYIDSPLALLGGANFLYYTNDANFNVTSLINGSTGAVSERSQYDPYGNVYFYTAAWVTATSSAADNPILYCGYTFDSESGSFLARYRYLNVAMGLWLTRDPLESMDGSNMYRYVTSNPIAMTDPFGEQGGVGVVPNPGGGFTTINPWAPPIPPSKPQSGSTATAVEVHFILGGGLTRLFCCDCGQKRTMLFAKFCAGGAIGGSGGFQTVWIPVCDPDKYKGWFYETGASAGPFSAGYDQGYNYDGSLSDTREAGIGVGVLGAKLKSTWCYYWLIDDSKSGVC